MEPFLGQIIMFAGNFAPRSWAFCNGQLLSISQNTALFSILGTTYGGDGQTTFALPDLRGRVPISPGIGPGLPSYNLGQRSGQANVTLTVNNMPNHNHPATTNTTTQIEVNTDSGEEVTPSGQYIAEHGDDAFSGTATSGETLAGATSTSSTTVGANGGGQSFNNMPPYLAVNYIIALFGTFPSRN
jgi:microcystin-dependent protein